MQKDPRGLFALNKKAHVASLLPLASIAAPILQLPAIPKSSALSKLFIAACQMQKDPLGLLAFYKTAHVASLLPLASIAAPTLQLPAIPKSSALKTVPQIEKPTPTPSQPLTLPTNTKQIPYRTFGVIGLGAYLALSTNEEKEVPPPHILEQKPPIEQTIAPIPANPCSQVPLFFMLVTMSIVAMMRYLISPGGATTSPTFRLFPSPDATEGSSSLSPTTPLTISPAVSAIPLVMVPVFNGASKALSRLTPSTPKQVQAAQKNRSLSTEAPPTISTSNFIKPFRYIYSFYQALICPVSQNKQSLGSTQLLPIESQYSPSPNPKKPKTPIRSNPFDSKIGSYRHVDPRICDKPEHERIPGLFSSHNIAEDKQDPSLQPYLQTVLAKSVNYEKWRFEITQGGVIRVPEQYKKRVIKAAELDKKNKLRR